jgi:hypothetical protein
VSDVQYSLSHLFQHFPTVLPVLARFGEIKCIVLRRVISFIPALHWLSSSMLKPGVCNHAEKNSGIKYFYGAKKNKAGLSRFEIYSLQRNTG